MIRWGEKRPVPFFIIGDARSGSTFLAKLLVSRFELSVTPETNFLPFVVENFGKTSIEQPADLDLLVKIVFKDEKFCDLGLTADDLEKRLLPHIPFSLSDFILAVLGFYRDAHFPEARLCGVKKGSYVYYHRDIQRLLPQSRFIGLIRDGRAVFNSKKRSLYSQTGEPFETSPKAAARIWSEKADLLRQIAKSCEKTLIVRYETLIEETEQTLDAIGLFLGMTQLRCDRHAEREYFVSSRYDSNLHRNIGKPPLRDRITAWREALSWDEITAFESVAHRELRREGYSLCTIDQDRGSSFQE